MRARSLIRQILLLAVLSALAQAQVVVTDDANTSSLYPTTNFGNSIALIVGSGSKHLPQVQHGQPGLGSNRLQRVQGHPDSLYRLGAHRRHHGCISGQRLLV